MSKFIIGKKIGMTRKFTERGSVPLTIVKAEPNTVLQVKDMEKDGYSAVQVGAGVMKDKKVTKPLAGHVKKADIKPSIIKEYKVEKSEDIKVGDKLDLSQFKPEEKVFVASNSKGKGYAGVIKRYGFARGPETHGSHHHRATGAIGGAYPQRVVKGRKMPGHKGSDTITTKNIPIIEVSEKDNIIVLEGSIPGAKNSWVVLKS